MVLYLKKVKLVNKLSDLTTKRVIILVLAMLFSVPIFTASTYINDNDSTDIGLAIIDYFKNDTKSKAFNISIDTYIDVHSNIKTPIISLYIQVDKYIYEWDKEGITPDDLRFSETGATILNDGDFTAIFDLRWYTKVSSALSVGRTIFICFVLATGALCFSKDANDLVIVPIESMIEKVNRIAKNPLEAAQEEENEELALEKNKNNNQTKTGCKYCRKSKKEAPYETVILERTIIKIGALLALGFGEAGTKIIADNISKTGDVDPMIPGTKVVAIFGFCDIRQFSDVTEVLQEDIMKFVNEIAEIIHNIVDHYSGSPNKNIGEMFLFVWKFQSEDEEIEEKTGALVPKKSHKVSQIADMSVVSFIKI